jgi:hypothetical protein
MPVTGLDSLVTNICAPVDFAGAHFSSHPFQRTVPATGRVPELSKVIHEFTRTGTKNAPSSGFFVWFPGSSLPSIHG